LRSERAEIESLARHRRPKGRSWPV
jgi:hypothetical protein